MLYYAYLGLGAFLMSLLGTRLMILALRRRRILMDVPNARSNHVLPTPRGGGLAVVFTIVIFMLVNDANYLLAAALLLLAIISLVDDWIRLSPLTRLAVQAMAVLLMLPATAPLLPDILPAWMDDALRVLLWLWFINLFNFMDGIDGIAGGEMISIAFGLLVLATLTATFGDRLSILALITLAAGCGFLWWNWHPAKIFLGDCGSVPIGFLLGYLLFICARQDYGAVALILPAVFVTDATVTLARRLWRGEKVWQAHSSHFYQQAVRGGRSHSEVAKLVIGVNMLLICIAGLAIAFPETAAFNVAVAYALSAALMWFFAHGKRKSAVA